MVHLGVDVLQRRQSRTSRVTVVPTHQRQAAHEQVLTDLKQGQCEKRLLFYNHVSPAWKHFLEHRKSLWYMLLDVVVVPCELPPPPQQKQSLCRPAWSDRGKPLRLSALKCIHHREEWELAAERFILIVHQRMFLCSFLVSGLKSHSRCVLVSHRPPRYPTTSLVVRWQWKSWWGQKAGNLVH